MYLNEFAIIAEDIDVEQARQIGLQYLNRMKIPFLLDGYHIALVIKCGLVHYPQQAQNSKDIVQKIGIAFDLKAKASALQVYDDVIAQAQKERFDLAAALLDALRNEDFYLVYQPKVSLSDGSVSGVEALIRWNRKNMSPISTDRFISIAEEMGIISDISKWVIRRSIQQAAEWKQRGVNLGIALNLSPNDLKDSSVINYLIRSIEENALDPAMIEVELTERALSKNTEAMLGLLETLRKLGVKISLDDLGTGYNSLIDLVIIPIDHIKIDKSFIENILCEEYRLLIQAIIGYAHNSDKKVIAEGVETEAQLRALETLGCDYVQGYYFSQPLPVMQMETYLAAL